MFTHVVHTKGREPSLNVPENSGSPLMLVGRILDSNMSLGKLGLESPH